MEASKVLIAKMNTSDILRLLERLGIPETSVKYVNGGFILPTICHNDLIKKSSYKL